MQQNPQQRNAAPAPAPAPKPTPQPAPTAAQRGLVGRMMTRDGSQVMPSASRRDAGQVATRLSELRARTDLRRSVAEAPVVDAEARTIDLSFSSTTPVSRWFGEEILSHAPGAMDTSRLEASAPFLWMHNWDDQRGVVVPGSIRVEGDQKGRAKIKYSRSPAGEQLFMDTQDGITVNVSVGYRILDAQLIEVRDDDVEVWLITRWQPYEISAVSVPADTAVGAGRSAENPQEEQRTKPAENSQHPNSATRTESQPKAKPTMNEKILRNAAGHLVRAQVDEAGNIVKELEVLERAGDDVQAHLRNGTNAEQKRTRALLDMGDKYAKLIPDAGRRAAKAIREGQSPEQLQADFLEAVNQRNARPLSEQSADAEVGLSDRDVERFSFMRAIRALLPNATRADREAAAFEFECSDAAQRRYGRAAQGILVPAEVLARSHAGMQAIALRAAMNTGGMAGGIGNQTGAQLVQNTTMWGSFIDLLRNRTTIMRMGSIMAGLTGTVDVPKKLTDGQGYWLGEGDDAQETGFTLGQIALSPKTVGAFTELTRRLLMQSTPDAEGMVRFDLVNALSQTIDKAGYYGAGTDKQPRGIKNHAGINGVDFAALRPTFAELVQMETEVSADNADIGQMGYVSNARFRGHAKTTLKFAAASSATIWEPGNTVNGYRAEITNQVQDGDVFFGNFADLMIGMWGGLDLTVSQDGMSKSGGLRVVAFQDVDFNLRRLESIVLGSQAVA